MAFFLRKNHWVKIWGGGKHFHFWPQTWVVKMDVFGHRGQIWPDQKFFGPQWGRHQNPGRNEVWNTSETQKLTEIWLKPFFSENAKKIMDFGGLVCSGSSWELILGFLSGPNASWVSVLPTKPAGKVWATSKKIFWGVVQILWKASIEISYSEEHNHKPDHTSSIVKALEEEAIQRGLKDVNLKALDLYNSFKENVLKSEVGEKGLPYIRTHYNFIGKLHRRKLECGLKEKKLAGGKRPRRKFY